MTHASLLGVWRRELIAWPDGRRDTTTSVHWLQAGSVFADLRLPQGERDAAIVEGFAGHITLDGDVCTWHRRIDYQPPGAPPDVGRLSFDGDLLIEDGVHLPYIEYWRRIDDGAAGVLVLELCAEPGLLVRVGHHAMRALSGGEISHAHTIGTSAWRIHASTLTECHGETLGFRRDGADFIDRQGRRWRVAEASADPAPLLPGEPS